MGGERGGGGSEVSRAKLRVTVLYRVWKKVFVRFPLVLDFMSAKTFLHMLYCTRREVEHVG